MHRLQKFTATVGFLRLKKKTEDDIHDVHLLTHVEHLSNLVVHGRDLSAEMGLTASSANI